MTRLGRVCHPSARARAMSAASATSATARPGALEFLAAQPWFDPSAEPWPCGGDELFVGLVTFELAGDGLQRNAESRDVLLDFKAPLLASRTQSQFRLALRKARPRPYMLQKRHDTVTCGVHNFLQT